MTIDAGERIAIIGMSCRLPGAMSVAEFWENLCGNKQTLSSFTDDELLSAGVDPKVMQAPNYIRSRGIIGNADHFDAAFFGVTPRDAELLDPQQRVFLECAWHALEDAGYSADRTDARIGVFGGTGTNWHLGQVSNVPAVKKNASGASVVTSNDKDYLTTRVSYKLGLTGPSVNVQSACSTAMVATMLGISSLREYQSDMVLVGGATIEIPETKGYLYQEGGMESADGVCRPFDADANGTVFSRGAGVVVLKRLEDAVRDRDHIYAVILDGAVNNDGRDKVGFTAPSVNGQVEVALDAFARADISAETISFVEAHGTATPVGDPIEVTALNQTFRHYTDRTQFCALGSVKGNIGHTDVASGAASLIKVALSLKNGLLPASLNFSRPNPKIDFTHSPFYVATQNVPLQKGDTPRRALINSFGVGGTNVCALIEEPPPAPVPVAALPQNVVVLSANTETALAAQAENLAAHLVAHPDLDATAVAYTLQVGRKDLPYRRHVAFAGREDLIDKLGKVRPGSQALCQRDDDRVVFAFPGQGNQYVGMGAELYRAYPVFREVVDTCAALLEPLIGLDLRTVLFATGDKAAEAATQINQTRLTQPALFVISYAQARLWQSWGLQPDAMIGHSIGEYVAACLAGVFSLKEALTLVAHRARLVQALPGGDMLAVMLPETDVLPLLPPDIDIAAVNAPQFTVVAGPGPAIAAFRDALKAKKIGTKPLDTSHAFHSAMMEPALPDFARLFETITLSEPDLPIASTVTGTWLTAAEATDPQYWIEHVRRTVRFADALATLFADSHPHIVLECGPGNSLASAAKSQLDRDQHFRVIGSQPVVNAGDLALDTLLSAVGALWAAGRPIAWDALYGEILPGRVSLPRYPFERQKFALDFTRAEAVDELKEDARRDDVGAWFYAPSWKRTVAPRDRGAPGGEPACWLVFDDGGALADEVASTLETAGHDVVRLMAGESFSARADGYALRAGAAADYDALVAALKADGHRPTRILHLWNAGVSDNAAGLDAASHVRDRAFNSPLYLEQALIKHNMTDGIRMVVAASGALSVAGEPITAPLRALAVGPCRVVGKEAPTLRARFADVAPSAGLAALLIAETGLDSDDLVVAYRGGFRFAETYDETPLDAADGLADAIRPDGTYLVTGGLGGLGLFFARAIAGTARVNLVLTHRAPMPARAEWADWLATHDAEDATSQRIAGVLEIEQGGSRVMLAEVDSADLGAMTDLVTAIAERFGPVDGVIHSAGTAGGGIISLKTAEMIDAVLDAKVEGALVLDRLFADAPLDFMVLFSSITAVLGEAGRVDYCAANSFMDALANQWAQRRPGIVRALNWDAWAEFGMAARWDAKDAGTAPSRPQPGHWLQLFATEGSKEIYDVRLNPKKDWVTDKHRVFDIPTLVGTTFLELAHRFAEIRQPGARAVLNNAYFISPLMFPNGENRRLRLFVDDLGDRFKLSFRSQSLAASGANWHEHFMCELVLEAGAPVRHDLAALKARFDGDVDDRPFFLRVDTPDGAPLLSFDRRWDTVRQVRLGANEWLSELELDPAFGGDFAEFDFHPALTDVSLVAAIRLITDSPYLPFSYRQAKLSARYPARLWSHIRLNGNFAREDETLTYDVVIMDDAGTELASFAGYSLKKVAATSAAPAARAPTPAAKVNEDIRPAEGLDALNRVFGNGFAPQVVITPKDLHFQIEDEKPSRKAAKKKREEEEKAAAQAASYARPPLSTPYEAPENEIEKAIAGIWQGILGIGEIGVNDDFTELGGNSLIAVQTVANIADAFHLELPVETFYANPTVRGLATAVLDQLIALAGSDTLDQMISELED